MDRLPTRSTLILLSLHLLAATAFSWPSTKYLIAFGDSYTYVHGTHGRQNYSFIGDLQHLSYTPSELLSNRIVQNQTATAEGGPNWIEYITNCGVHPGLMNPRDCEKQLWDFAFAGADVKETEYTPLHHNFTVSLVQQVEQFVFYGEPVLKEFEEKEKTLVVFWIGINDIGDTAKLTNVSFPVLYEEIIGTLFEEGVQRVARLGYRDFLFMNLPPLDRTPGNVVRVGGPLPNKTMVGWWDDTLERHVEIFKEEREGVWAKVFDANTFLNGVMDEHEKYGIKNITGYCASYDQPLIDSDPGMYGCLPLNDYFWFNTGHMTSSVHKILSSAVEEWLNAFLPTEETLHG